MAFTSIQDMSAEEKEKLRNNWQRAQTTRRTAHRFEWQRTQYLCQLNLNKIKKPGANTLAKYKIVFDREKGKWVQTT